MRRNRKGRKGEREEEREEKRRGTIPNNFLMQYLTIILNPGQSKVEESNFEIFLVLLIKVI